MVILKNAAGLTAFIGKKIAAKQNIGFVPTMGALHQGHISLVEACKNETDFCVCSIFINPTQFNNPDDFKKYPVTIEEDIDKLERAGCDLLFLPSVEEIYPAGSNLVKYDLGQIETVLEGKFRPGHYQGVCQVVDRLLSLTSTSVLYLGQKDYQQCMVINKLIELKNYPVEVIIKETIREADGLAMSSRNLRLSTVEREQAIKIFEALTSIKNNLKPGGTDDLTNNAVSFLSANGFKTDYIEIADAANLAILNSWDGKTNVVILAAAWLNEIRLIDNLLAGSHS